MPQLDLNVPERPHILIVDDLPANLGVLLAVLDGAGYEVLVATSGEGALQRLTYMRPDLILLDVNMPGLDGYETCRRLKADTSWQEVPVLFLTAQDDPLDKVRGFGVGAVDYITKPLHAEEVLARVRTHLQIRSLQQMLEEKNRLLEAAVARRREAEAHLQQSLDRAVVLVAPGGEVEFCTQLARRLLEQHFPEHAGAASLPESLAAWLSNEATIKPWQTSQNGEVLKVQVFAPTDLGDYRMLLLEQRSLAASTPAQLLQFGLTVREAEVLFWVAHGKSNQEVALILDTSLNTIKKHVANLLVKMGAESRLTAALQAAEVLELRTSDPIRSSHS